MRTRRLSSPGDPVGGTHRTVLLHEAVDALQVRDDSVIVDATLGGAGHSQEIAKKLGPKGVLIGFDADVEAVERSREVLKDIDAKTYFIHANFRELDTKLGEIGIAEIDGALFDLGWSGFQLSAGRGFSFLKDEPLSMAYDARSAFNAYKVVNDWEESSLADVIFGWGEERYARRIAKRIVEAREKQPIRTSGELAEIVSAAVPAGYRRGRIHPATKTFQAIRIAVNDELGALDAGLRSALARLKKNGRLAVIAFHSLEDRDVKRLFAGWENEGRGARITKRPLTASEEEITENPRARSAKLRIFQKH